MLPELSLVLLSYNEERNIEKAVSSADTIGRKVAKKYEIVVSHYEGSTDRTWEILNVLKKKYKRMRIVHQPREQKGYGVGLRLGLRAARYAHVFYTDADNQFNLEEITRLLPYVEQFDIVSGYRMKRRDPFGRILTSKVYNVLLRIIFGLKVRDVDSAFKIYRKKVIDAISINAKHGIVDAEILIKARNLGFRIKEVPVHHYARHAGVSNYGTGFIKLNVVTTALSEMRELWKELKK
jgi:glycosyltransferase involved in cell wall biosynthesis